MHMCTFLALHMRILHFTLQYVCCVSHHVGASSTSSLENCNADRMLCGGRASATGLCPQLLSLVSTLYTALDLSLDCAQCDSDPQYCSLYRSNVYSTYVCIGVAD